MHHSVQMGWLVLTCLVFFYVIASVIMETGDRAVLQSFLKVLPPVDFCCVYGSALHPNNREKVSFYLFIVLFSLLILHFTSLSIFFFFNKNFALKLNNGIVVNYGRLYSWCIKSRAMAFSGRF